MCYWTHWFQIERKISGGLRVETEDNKKQQQPGLRICVASGAQLSFIHPPRAHALGYIMPRLRRFRSSLSNNQNPRAECKSHQMPSEFLVLTSDGSFKFGTFRQEHGQETARENVERQAETRPPHWDAGIRN
jgi:hypothetical protein